MHFLFKFGSTQDGLLHMVEAADIFYYIFDSELDFRNGIKCYSKYTSMVH